MEIHLYALCWNELDILPFFFRHYDPFVTRYFIYDNGSTDGSVEYLRGMAKVELRRFVPSDLTSFVRSEQSFSGECWKLSRATADWVIVTDVDEHLYHPDIVGLLRRYKALGITLAPALGFEMVSDGFPRPDERLCETRVRGAPSGYYSKLSIFDPDAISELTYGPGRHCASATGRLAAPRVDELRLFHYKHMGYDHTRRRYRQLRLGLGATDIANGWAGKLSWVDERFAREWRELAAAAIDVHNDEAVFDFHAPLWWEPLRLGAPTAMTEMRVSLVGRELRQLIEDLPIEMPASAAADPSLDGKPDP